MSEPESGEMTPEQEAEAREIIKNSPMMIPVDFGRWLLGALDATRKLLAAERKAREEAEESLVLVRDISQGRYEWAKRTEAERDAFRREAEELRDAEKNAHECYEEMRDRGDRLEAQAERLWEAGDKLANIAETIAWDAKMPKGIDKRLLDASKDYRAQAIAPESGEGALVTTAKMSGSLHVLAQWTRDGHITEEMRGALDREMLSDLHQAAPSPSPEAGECQACSVIDQRGLTHTWRGKCKYAPAPAASEEGSDGR